MPMPDSSKVQPLPRRSPRKKRIPGQNLLSMSYMADDWDAPMTPEELAEFEEGEVFPAVEGDDPLDRPGN